MIRLLCTNTTQIPSCSLFGTCQKGAYERVLLGAQVAAGNSIRYLTPDAVVQYIQECQLYREGKQPPA